MDIRLRVWLGAFCALLSGMPGFAQDVNLADLLGKCRSNSLRLGGIMGLELSDTKKTFSPWSTPEEQHSRVSGFWTDGKVVVTQNYDLNDSHHLVTTRHSLLGSGFYTPVILKSGNAFVENRCPVERPFLFGEDFRVSFSQLNDPALELDPWSALEVPGLLPILLSNDVYLRMVLSKIESGDDVEKYAGRQEAYRGMAVVELEVEVHLNPMQISMTNCRSYTKKNLEEQAVPKPFEEHRQMVKRWGEYQGHRVPAEVLREGYTEGVLSHRIDRIYTDCTPGFVDPKKLKIETYRDIATGEIVEFEHNGMIQQMESASFSSRRALFLVLSTLAIVFISFVVRRCSGQRP